MADRVEPGISKKFKELDKVYTNLLDLEMITLQATDSKEVGYLSHLARGGIARMVTRIPGIEAPVAAGSILTKVGAGKDVTKVAEAISAQRLFKKAKSLAEKAENPSLLRKKVADNPEIAAAMAGTSAGIFGSKFNLTDQKIEPYKLNQKAAKIIEKATPETIMQEAQKIREMHGESGERLAMTLEKLSKADRIGKQGLLFTILSNPHNVRMLTGRTKVEEK